MEQVYIYRMNYDELSKEKSELLELLPEWRKAKAEKIKNEPAKLQSIAAGRLLDITVSKHLGADNVNWARCEEGRVNELYFNLSHCDKYVAATISDNPIGIDVECKDDKNFAVSSRMFSEEDKAYIGNDQNRFRDVWTAKEAFLKCTREGIIVPLKSFTLDYTLEKACLVRPIEYDMKDRQFYVITCRLYDEECSLSICSENPNLALDIHNVEVLR